MSKQAAARARVELELHDSRIAYAEQIGARVTIRFSLAIVFAWRDASKADVYAQLGELVLDGVTGMSDGALALLRAAEISDAAVVGHAEDEVQMLLVGEAYEATHVRISTVAGDDVRIDCASAVALAGQRLRFLEVFTK